MEQELFIILREIRFMLFILTIFACVFMFFGILKGIIRINKYFDDAKVDAFINRANKLFEKANYAKLIEHCKEQLEDSPNDSNAYWWLARAKQELKEFDEARSLYEKVLELEPSWRESHIEPYLKKIEKNQ